MKKTTILFCVLLFAAVNSNAQTVVNLFNTATDEAELGLVDTYSLLSVNDDAWEEILTNHPSRISLSIPYGDTDLNLTLRKTELFREDFQVRTASGDTLVWNEISRSVYYHGTFTGHAGSHFALSVLNNEIIGVGSIPAISDVNLGKLKDQDEYVFYAENALDGINDFHCETRGEPTVSYNPRHEGSDDRRVWSACSGMYFEVDYDIYLDKGGLVGATDYITALFNEVAYLFELADMGIFLEDMLVWDIESPYYEISDTGVLLDLFGTTTTEWDGDLGHFVNYAAGGGLAWVDVFCHPNQAIRKAVSGIAPTFAEVPVYSWSVEVISHEMGHNFGSPHTHACFWNGDDTAIDGCGPEAGFPEGCDAFIPPLGGTVMSYCHLLPVGINLGLGFGLQPGTHIRNRMASSDCLVGCDLTIMDVEVLSGTISETCENGPIDMTFGFTNNGNEPLNNFRVELYIDGELFDFYDWGGEVLEEDTSVFSFPEITLPAGSYTIVMLITSPNGYIDDSEMDNSFTFNVDVTPYPVANFTATPDELNSLNAETKMDNLTEGASTYEWDFGDGSEGSTNVHPTHTFPFERGGNYRITLIARSEFGCQDTAYGNVFVKGENIFYIENAFTPDGDLFNENFKPIFSAGLDIYDYHLVIYNRWGEIVFESYDASKGWDGSYGGTRPAPSGTYVWSIDFGDLSSDKKHSYTGHVNLIR
ncbi:MAG: gliding motility-associated C-terminal domain-containing protein [Crocinitomicaceae bacterium]